MQIKNLFKTYKTKSAVTEALKGISFDLPDKGMVFILGKSGSGKTTLLNVLSGLDGIDGGDIKYKGKSFKEFTEKESDEYRNNCCGFIFQDYNLIPELNVGDNIGLALQLQGGKESGEKVSQVLKRVELEGYETRKVTELSGGQKQRVAIARSIVKEPEIIFADEPTGALDQETGASIFGLLKELSRERLVITVTHDREFAEEYGDRIIELADGKIIRDTCGGYTDETESGSVKWPRPKMPLKAAVKIGCSNFRYHPIRLAATIILSVIAFSLLAVALTGAFNKRAAIAYNAFISEGLTQSAVGKRNSSSDIKIPIRQSEKDQLDGVLGVGTLGVVTDEISIDNLGEPEISTPFNSIMPQGYTAITRELLAEYGFSISGELPAKEDEIAITAFTAEILEECGLTGEKNRPGDNLVGGELIIEDKGYTVTGIIDTLFDGSPYAKLKEVREDDPDEINLLIEKLAKELNGGAHNLLFVNNPKDFANDGISLNYAQISFPQIRSMKSSAVNVIKSADENAAGGCYGTKGNIPGGDRVYLPASYIPELLRGFGCNVEFNGKTYSDCGELFLAEYNGRADGETDWATRQKIYIDIYGKYEEAFPESFSCKFVERAYEYETEFEVNGFFVNDGPDCGLLLGENIYKRIFGKIGGEYNALIAPIGSGLRHNLQKLVDGVAVGEFSFTFDNYVMEGVKKSDGMIATIKNVCTVLSVVFIAFSAVLLFNFMHLSVSEKTETIGILKAMGCNKGNLYKVFLMESVIIGLIISALSIGLSAIVCAVADGAMISILSSVNLSLFGFNGLATVLQFAVVMLFALFGAIMPLINISHKKPIDYIYKIN